MTSEEYAALEARTEALSPKGQELLHGMCQLVMEVADKAREAGRQEERERAKRIVAEECEFSRDAQGRHEMTLGKLIRLLEIERPDNTVRFDFGGFIPRRIGSWRGVYAELALGYDNDWRKPVTVAQLLAELKSAIGKTFTGYKGGEFAMDEGTQVWADNYGEYSNCAITGLADCDYQTVLATAFRA